MVFKKSPGCACCDPTVPCDALYLSTPPMTDSNCTDCENGDITLGPCVSNTFFWTPGDSHAGTTWDRRYASDFTALNDVYAEGWYGDFITGCNECNSYPFNESIQQSANVYVKSDRIRLEIFQVGGATACGSFSTYDTIIVDSDDHTFDPTGVASNWCGTHTIELDSQISITNSVGLEICTYEDGDTFTIALGMKNW